MMEEKIKISKFGILFSIIGILIIIISIIHWGFNYPDISQLLTGLGGGLILIGFAYLHSWMKMVDKIHKNIIEEFEEVNRTIDLTRDYIREIDNKMEEKNENRITNKRKTF